MTERSKESGSRRGMERKNNMKNRPQALPENVKMCGGERKQELKEVEIDDTVSKGKR